LELSGVRSASVVRFDCGSPEESGTTSGAAFCGQGEKHVRIGNENYMVAADGLLMPAKRGQQPPDLRYFSQGEVTGAAK
jgi:hypothetical protein